MRPGSTLMETYEYRRERLRQLLKEQFKNNQSDLARAIGVSHTTINDYLISARRTLGERRARRIEEQLDLKAGSLDKKPIEVQAQSPLSPPDRRQGQKPKRQRVAA